MPQQVKNHMGPDLVNKKAIIFCLLLLSPKTFCEPCTKFFTVTDLAIKQVALLSSANVLKN